MVRFVHISDTQLGKRVKNTRPGIINQELRALEDDFYHSWSTVVQDIVDKKIEVDAIIHSGDFFDVPCGYDNSAPPELGRKIVGQTLRQLQDANIPIVVIDGNHGRYVEYRSSTLSEYAAIFPNFHAFTYYDLRDAIRDCKPLIKDLEEINLRILAHPFIEARVLDNLNLRPAYEKWMEVQNSSMSETKVNVAVVHGMTIDKSLHESYLRVPYSYIALGHDHKMKKLTDHAWYSGSTTCWRFEETNYDNGYLIVDIKQGQAYPDVKAVRIPSRRPIHDLEVEMLEGDTSNTIIQKVKQIIDEKGLNQKYHYPTAARVRVKLTGSGLAKGIYSITEAEAYLRRLMLSSDEYNVVEFLFTTEQLAKVESETIEETAVDIEFLLEDPAEDFRTYLDKERKEAVEKEGLDPVLLSKIFAEVVQGEQQ